MSVKLKGFSWIISLVVCCMFAGCSSGANKQTVADPKPGVEKAGEDQNAAKKAEPAKDAAVKTDAVAKSEAPKEKAVLQTTGAFTLEGTRVLWALGRAAAVAEKNPALIRQAADMRARDALAKMIAGKTYTATSETTEGKVVHKKTITDTTLKGTRITDRWVDPKTSEHFSVAVIPLANSGLTKEKAELLFNKLEKELPAPQSD
ncbi:MAG: hypothetical protein JRJ87_07570 [Deltaproteobacteria bacterium]|nr:hypothetical protein [Deltaproteobacteria bacterium]